jgi:hypothetical protein
MLGRQDTKLRPCVSWSQRICLSTLFKLTDSCFSLSSYSSLGHTSLSAFALCFLLWWGSQFSSKYIYVCGSESLSHQFLGSILILMVVTCFASGVQEGFWVWRYKKCRGFCSPGLKCLTVGPLLR